MTQIHWAFVPMETVSKFMEHLANDKRVIVLSSNAVRFWFRMHVFVLWETNYDVSGDE